MRRAETGDLRDQSVQWRSADASASRTGSFIYRVRKGANGNQPIVIGAVNECLNATLDSLAAIIEKFCEPQVAIVSLTITEKGYCIDPATGSLDL